jgi:hypothetical protein
MLRSALGHCEHQGMQLNRTRLGQLTWHSLLLGLHRFLVGGLMRPHPQRRSCLGLLGDCLFSVRQRSLRSFVASGAAFVARIVGRSLARVSPHQRNRFCNVVAPKTINHKTCCRRRGRAQQQEVRTEAQVVHGRGHRAELSCTSRCSRRPA